MMRAATFNDGLTAAAKFLEGTAADYDQMATQREKDYERSGFGFASARAEVQGMRDKAVLLRGQAGHIRELKK